MNAEHLTTVLIVPGLREHVPEHWQTQLQARLPRARTVPPLEHDKLSCAARVAAIRKALADIEGPVIFVAHSAGAMMVVHWAALHAAERPIKGALLAAPPDLESPMPEPYPRLEALAANGWLPVPRRPLAFPAIVAASSNDPLASFARVAAMASDWHATLVDLGEVGHLNPASGFGEWARAEEFIRTLDR
jgi:uncharacterized protein